MQPGPRMMLGLSDGPDEALEPASWIGAFLALGPCLRKFESELGNRQLVIALSVPRRDYVAALIGAGWMLSSPPPQLISPIETFRSADKGAYLRAVTDTLVVTGPFSRLEEDRPIPRVLTGGKTRVLDYYKAVAVLSGSGDNIQSKLPEPGFLGVWTGVADTWLERMASPPSDLALVGTKKWILDDLDACIGSGGGLGTRLSNYVLPMVDHAATWSTAVIASARLADGDPLSADLAAVVLDRYGAIKYLNEIDVPIVVCVIDRSVVDESAAELIVQARSARSRPITLRDELGWSPPRGVEAMAFTVAL